MWLHGALDLHLSHRGHHPGDPWTVRRVGDTPCDGTTTHAQQVADKIMHRHGATL